MREPALEKGNETAESHYHVALLNVDSPAAAAVRSSLKPNKGMFASGFSKRMSIIRSYFSKFVY